MTEKRDESRDLYLDTFMICSGRELIERYNPADKAEFFGGVDVSRYVPVECLASVTRERDAALERVAKLEQERENVRCKLSFLSSKVGNGLGDESRSTASYVGAVDSGIDWILRVEAQRLSDSHKRIAELETAARALCREIRENAAEVQWPQVGMIEAVGLDAIAEELEALESLLTPKEPSDDNRDVNCATKEPASILRFDRGARDGTAGRAPAESTVEYTAGYVDGAREYLYLESLLAKEPSDD